MTSVKNSILTAGLSCLIALPVAGIAAENFNDSVTITPSNPNLNSFLKLESSLINWTLEAEAAGDFSIAHGTTVPFAIDPSAPAGAFFVSAAGNVGLGTTTPGGDYNARLHIVDETPDIVFDAITQVWDLFATADGLGITDETADTLPFFIEPAAPSASFLIRTSGYVGLGVDPAAKLHLSGDSAVEEDVQVLVENFNTGSPGEPRKLFVVKNDGPVKFSMWASATDEWAFNGRPNEFRISKQGSKVKEMEVQAGGNVLIAGTLTEGSSRYIKNNIVEVEPQDVLAKLVALPISEWTYNHDEAGVRHLGPMAEDFRQSFGLGKTDKGLASIDTSGVALAAIKGLHEQLQEKDDQIQSLQNQLQNLETRQGDRILQLEMMLSEVVRQQASDLRVGSVD